MAKKGEEEKQKFNKPLWVRGQVEWEPIMTNVLLNLRWGLALEGEGKGQGDTWIFKEHLLALSTCFSQAVFTENRGVRHDCRKADAEWTNKTSFSSVAQSCLTLRDPMNRSTPGLPVHHQLPEFTQTHVHRVRDAIQPSHPLSFPSPPAPNPSQHQSLFQWVNSSHEVAKVLEFQL